MCVRPQRPLYYYYAPLNVHISSHHRGEQSTDYFVCHLTAAEVTRGGPNETGGYVPSDYLYYCDGLRVFRGRGRGRVSDRSNDVMPKTKI